LPEFGKRVEIVLDLIGSSEKFKGTMTEAESKYATGEISEIEGLIEDDFIQFFNKYKQDHNLSSNEFVAVQNKKSYEVYYTGFYDDERESFFGSWELRKYVIEDHEEFDLVYEGIWIIKRV
jgi:hypothetical protein